MKLLRVEVDHFACLHRVAVDLGPGLNVLFGPNDLGKSTLARAIRAVLLIPHKSAVTDDFVEWDSGETPSVKLTIELPDRRIWRIEKRFGIGGSSVLRESTDGVTFSPFKKAREVDEEIRTRLGWGIASPATKGAPRGLPESFLAKVLLGEQTDVAGILGQTLDADTDESGRARLTSALEAFAQDPLFKSILEEAQGKVDEAFTTKGTRKRGQASPFREATDEVKQVKEYLDSVKKRVEESENARLQLEACNEAQSRSQDARDQAIAHRDVLRKSREQFIMRQGVEQKLADARKTLDGQQAQIDALAEREATLTKTHESVAAIKSQKAQLEESRSRLVTREKAAEETVRRARSADAEQARQLRRGELQKQTLELEANAKSLATETEKANTARTLTADLKQVERQVVQLEETRNKNRTLVAEAESKKRDTERELELLEVARRVSVRRKTQASIDELEKVRTEVQENRTRAKKLRTRAQELESQITKDLPTREQFDAMQRLERDLELAEASLGGGLAVVVERLAPVALNATADGTDIDLAADGSISFEALRDFNLQIGDLAKISVTAGERAARQRTTQLRERWEAEVTPILQRLGLGDFANLTSSVETAAELQRQAEEVTRSANSQEERATLREEQLVKLGPLVTELEALNRELESESTDEAETMLEGLGKTPVEVRQEQVKKRQREAIAAHDEAMDRARTAETEKQVLSERNASLCDRLGSLDISEPEHGWDEHLTQLATRMRSVATDQKQIAGELESLVAEQNAEIKDAEAALAEVQESIKRTNLSLEAVVRELEKQQGQANQLSGEIGNRKAAVAEFEIQIAKERVNDLTTRLAELPAARTITEADLQAAEAAVTEAERDHSRARDEVRKAEGALQTFGGQVILEEEAAARDALNLAEQKEREVELEYDAWRLLVEKLREAENTEGCHLGEALSQPVTKRFAELTAERYGKLEVAPSLRTEGLRVSGVVRRIDALSVGTQEQLATLLRLTVAEHLGSTLLLDDHLTQTDPERSAWFRDVLREHAGKSQVVVLTCRPLDYLLESDLPKAGEASTSRAAGLVRAIDLSRMITRDA